MTGHFFIVMVRMHKMNLYTNYQSFILGMKFAFLKQNKCHLFIFYQ